MGQNVFVIGLDDFQRGELETITNAHSIAFRQLLAPEVVTRPEEHAFEELLALARRELEAFDGTVDAIIAHWDFPTSVLAPVLAAERGLPAPSLGAVVRCEHKHLSRLAQAASVPEVVPAFAAFDPFDDDPLAEIDLDFPFWIKPVKSHSSQLGFRIEDEEQFAAALGEMRQHITDIGDAFEEVLDRVELPEGVAGGNTCLAEKIVSGRQIAPEGALHRGEFAVHGILDMPKDVEGAGFDRLDYPASLPDDLQQRMVAVCERMLRHIGFDDGCFNAEFLWDEDADQLWLIEVNTRISQSHADLFTKVDGMSNHEVAVDVALGVRPRMPDRRGDFRCASKCLIYTTELDDGIVERVPDADDIARVQEAFPETRVQIDVEPGDRLSELPDQSPGRYDLGTLYIGADSREEIARRHHVCLELLPFEFAPVEATR